MAWLKNSDGKPDAMFTMSIVGFVLVVLKLLIAGASVSVGDFSLSAGSVGGDEIAALLTPTFGTYAFRRYTDKKFAAEAEGAVDPEVPDGE